MPDSPIFERTFPLAAPLDLPLQQHPRYVAGMDVYVVVVGERADLIRGQED